MFPNVFDEFSKDPFFDFGSSPFNEHPLLKPGRTRARSLPRIKGPSDENSAPDSNALVSKHEFEQPERHRDAGGRRFEDALTLPGFGRNFGDVFTSMNSMMQNLSNQMMDKHQTATREDFDGHMYSHSSVYSYSNDGKEKPRVYQAMSETRAGPGGVRETRKAMRDSATREERMAVGRHIGQRGHTIERRRNGSSEGQVENHHYSGIDEREGAAFDDEWQSRAKSIVKQQGHLRHGKERKAVTDGKSSGDLMRHRA